MDTCNKILTTENEMHVSSSQHLCSPLLAFILSAEVLTAFSYQCRSAEDRIRMWDQCKTSIVKRCQNLRQGDEQNRED